MAETAETIEASGRRVGHHAWVEMRLFETLGAWSATMDDPRARALLAAQSQHHAWHAELWHGLLPAVPHLPAADLVAPAEGDPEMVAALADLDDDPPAGAAPSAPSADTSPSATAVDTAPSAVPHPRDSARLAAVYEDVLPRLVAAYEDHLARTSPLTDGPTTRVLRLALADLADDTQAGLDLIATLDRR